MARSLTDTQHADHEREAQLKDEGVVIFMLTHPESSLADIARGVGRQKYEVQRAIDRYRKAGLVEKETGLRSPYALTAKGVKMAKTAEYNHDAAGATYG
jgi:DNA-binding transcriptional regulator PaaX